MTKNEKTLAIEVEVQLADNTNVKVNIDDIEF